HRAVSGAMFIDWNVLELRVRDRNIWIQSLHMFGLHPIGRKSNGLQAGCQQNSTQPTHSAAYIKHWRLAIANWLEQQLGVTALSGNQVVEGNILRPAVWVFEVAIMQKSFRQDFGIELELQII